MPYFLLTNDVEYTLIHANVELRSVAQKITDLGIMRLLELYSKHDVRSTFYFTGNFAEAQPHAIELVKEKGHEIGCHGYSHDRTASFDSLGFEEQHSEIMKAKNAIEKVAGPIVSFRSPELRINKDTIKALSKTEFKTDSSIASQRFDGPLSLGFKYKKNWLFTPRNPYFLSFESPFKRGNSTILEIPISAALVPYIGSSLRISPGIIKYIEKYLFWEARNTGKPIVFIFHPHECMSVEEIMKNGNDVVCTAKGNFFSEVLRPKLKCRNLGIQSIDLLETIIVRAKNYGFTFITARDLYELYIKELGGK